MKLQSFIRGSLLAAALAGGIVVLAGCDTSDPMEEMYNGPSAALSNPMGYTPDMENADVMGGGTATYNDKAMQQDLHDLFDPTPP